MSEVRASATAEGGSLAYRHLVVTRDNYVLTCKLSNPPRHTLNVAMLNEINDLLDRVESDQQLRVVVFTGAADGIFLRWFELTEVAEIGRQAGMASGRSAADDSDLTVIQRLGCRIEKLPQVTIAAINGFAAGGACGLSLCFDFRILMSGDDRYLFGAPQTTFGITTCGGQSVRYVRMLGTARALDLLLHGSLLAPEEAERIGLVSRVYPKETYYKDLDAFVQRLAGRAPLALRGIKKLVRTAPELTMPDALRHEMVEYAKVVNSRDAKKAIAAVDAIEDPDPRKFSEFHVDFEGA
jgi:enoyl-CoA hydratase/carnithine racemase